MPQSVNGKIITLSQIAFSHIVMPQPQTIDTLLAKLNPEQRAAATHGEGPLLIVAGAGTGKTTTLVHRVAWLIAQGIDPSRILLLTFTRRAAAEMLRRVDSLLRQLAILPSPFGRGAGGEGGEGSEDDDLLSPLPCHRSKHRQKVTLSTPIDPLSPHPLPLSRPTFVGARERGDIAPRGFGAALFMPSPRGCCGDTASRSACRRNFRSTTAPTRKI